MKIALIACTSKKSEEAKGTKVAAKDLYVSPLFRMAYAYAEKLGVDRVYILSAKYGLLEPGDPVDWYNETLLKQRVPERRAWAERVLSALQAKGVNMKEDTFYLLAGKIYYQYLLGEGKLQNYVLPYKGLKGIGYILKFLKSNLQEYEEH